MLNTIREISMDTKEGRLLLSAIAKISTESQTNKTPDQILSQIVVLSEKMYKDELVIN